MRPGIDARKSKKLMTHMAFYNSTKMNKYFNEISKINF